MNEREMHALAPLSLWETIALAVGMAGIVVMWQQALSDPRPETVMLAVIATALFLFTLGVLRIQPYRQLPKPLSSYSPAEQRRLVAGMRTLMTVTAAELAWLFPLLHLTLPVHGGEATSPVAVFVGGFTVVLLGTLLFGMSVLQPRE